MTRGMMHPVGLGGPVHAEHEQCPRCRYSLQGLPIGSPCPECGHGIAPKAFRRASWRSDQLTQAPPAYTRVLALGLWLMIVGGFATIACLLTMGLNVWPSSNVQVVAGVGAAMLWYAGLILVVRPRPPVPGVAARSGLPEWTILRTIAVLSQASWLGVPVLFEIASRASAPQSFNILANVVLSIGMLGAVSVAAYLWNLSHWARDDRAGRLAMLAAWGLLLGPALLAGIWALDAVGVPSGGLMALFLWLVPVLWMTGIVALFLTLLSLAGDTSWAIRNHQEAIDRDQRLFEKARQQQVAPELVGLPWPEPAAPPPLPPPAVTPTPLRTDGYRVEE